MPTSLSDAQRLTLVDQVLRCYLMPDGERTIWEYLESEGVSIAKILDGVLPLQSPIPYTRDEFLEMMVLLRAES